HDLSLLAAKFRVEPQPPERRLLYRRRPLSPPLSPLVSPPSGHRTRGGRDGPLPPEMRDSAVSVAGNRPVSPKMRPRSLAWPNFFPAGIPARGQRTVRMSAETGDPAAVEIGMQVCL